MENLILDPIMITSSNFDSNSSFNYLIFKVKLYFMAITATFKSITLYHLQNQASFLHFYI